MATTADTRWGTNEPPPATEVEQYGIAPIPPEDRTATPFDLFRVAFGGANTFATVVLGAFPILVFGLSFWEGFLAMMVGVVVGGLILMPMALFGPANGTNNAVSSGAHFGVIGRIVGSFLSLLVAITFFAISVYTSGDILIGAVDRLFGTGQPEWLLAIAYAFFAVVVLVVCLYGFRFMLGVNKVAVILATLMYLLGIAAFADDFDPGYEGFREDLLPAFIGGALIVMANPLSFGAFLGDWARYIPPTAGRARLMAAAFFSQFATIIPFTFGLATAAIIAEQAPEAAEAVNYAGGSSRSRPTGSCCPSASSRSSVDSRPARPLCTGRVSTSPRSFRSSAASSQRC
jgi:purine-cytosine permease-like protein